MCIRNDISMYKLLFTQSPSLSIPTTIQGKWIFMTACYGAHQNVQSISWISYCNIKHMWMSKCMTQCIPDKVGGWLVTCSNTLECNRCKLGLVLGDTWHLYNGITHFRELLRRCRENVMCIIIFLCHLSPYIPLTTWPACILLPNPHWRHPTSTW